MTARTRITGRFPVAMPDDVAAFARAIAPCQRQVEDGAGLGLNPALVFRHGAVAAGIRAGLAG